MSFPLQAKLLQVLQDGEFSRLGGKHDVQVDVRVIAATNRDLETAVADGQFREDLYFRLNVVDHQPAAAARAARGDPAPHRLLPEEVLRSVQQAARRASAPRLTRLFMDYDWPGNVRELENLIKRMVVLGTEAPIRKELQRTSMRRWPIAARRPLRRRSTAAVTAARRRHAAAPPRRRRRIAAAAMAARRPPRRRQRTR